MKKFINTLLAVIAIALTAQAQLVEPIKWTGKVDGDSIRLTATIEKGWHLNIIELGDADYDDEYEGTFTAAVAKADTVRVRFNACDDKMCTAPEIFEFVAPVATAQAPQQLLQPVQWTAAVEGDSVRLTATIQPGWHLNILELGEGEWEDQYEGTFTTAVAMADTVRVRFNACDDKSCIAPEIFEFVTLGEKAKGEETKGEEGEKSIWWVFVMGLLGGLLAIFTPCVWPIIPMTVSFFIKRGGAEKGTTNAQVIRDAIFYGLSIIIIYVGLGLLVTLIFGASALNALSTNAVVNIIFFLILVLFAASFFGAFEITLPSSWSTALNSKSRSTSGFLSILLMAFTLVIVSFSCTGPIIGTLLVEAAGKSLLAPTMGMLGFAIALALPFSVFAMFPSILKNLPKSGGWMNTFKVTLAFLELALALKFLSVADLAYGWHILDREVFVALWIVIFSLLGMYLLGLIAFPHDDDDHRKTSVPRLFLAIISLSFAMYMVPGLWGAPLRAISAFAPPMSTQDWVMTPGGSGVQAVGVQASSDYKTMSVHEGQITFTDYDEGMAYAKENNMPVFLDFNGYGCVNCRKMEAAVLSKPEVAEHMHKYVLISLIVDDKTKLDEPIVIEENGKTTTLKTIGDKWSYMQRTQYQSNAQPYYVQLNADGTKIVESSYAYDEDIEKFLNWLAY
ncbi:MAG: thioredoxin family protein [Paludibacteraceae bacterium]|nr:thioredoxin family protein [Paludibacteraceae bacterium]